MQLSKFTLKKLDTHYLSAKWSIILTVIQCIDSICPFYEVMKMVLYLSDHPHKKTIISVQSQKSIIEFQMKAILNFVVRVPQNCQHHQKQDKSAKRSAPGGVWGDMMTKTWCNTLDKILEQKRKKSLGKNWGNMNKIWNFVNNLTPIMVP